MVLLMAMVLTIMNRPIIEIGLSLKITNTTYTYEVLQRPRRCSPFLFLLLAKIENELHL
jgi:hypothetical protein